MVDKTGKLIENNIALQSKIVDLVSSVNNLNKRIGHLVDIFEGAAKDVKEVKGVDEQVSALANKLEMLLEQNKSIAKGLLLLEKYVRGRTEMNQLPPKPLTEYKY